jgi:hypothetical protein
MTAPQEQKLKITGPVVVTANRLGDGAVVYRTLNGNWSTALVQAAVVDTAPAPTAAPSPAICASGSGSPARPSICRLLSVFDEFCEI